MDQERKHNLYVLSLAHFKYKNPASLCSMITEERWASSQSVLATKVAHKAGQLKGLFPGQIK